MGADNIDHFPLQTVKISNNMTLAWNVQELTLSNKLNKICLNILFKL